MSQRLRSTLEFLERVPAACWVVLLTLPALAPLARSGFLVSDDGLIHAYRLAALDRAVRAGVLLPRWFPEFAFGYGHPVLNFYGPLSYYWGLPFTLAGIDAAAALELVLAVGLVASALGMVLFARQHLDRGPAIVAAVVYAYLPYHLVDLYLRGALAEFLAFVWMPLVLWSFGRLIAGAGAGTRGARLALAALLLAALVITHSLSALIFAPLLILYVILLLWVQRDRGAVGRVALAAVVAVGVSAFYWLPVLVESPYAGLGHGASQGYLDHLLPLLQIASGGLAYRYVDTAGGPRTYPLGWLPLSIWALAAVLLPRLRGRRWLVLLFLATALVTTFMLTTASVPLWAALEGGLAFLQYPWRFLVLTALATAFLAGAAVQGLAGTRSAVRWLAGAALVLATVLSAVWRLPLETDAQDMQVTAMWQRDREAGQIGATWTGEYLPVWVEEQRWAISLPDPEPASGNTALPAGQLALTGVAPTRYEFEVTASGPLDLALHQFHYPGWQARWQGETVPSEPAGILGLASFRLAAGEGRLTARLALTAAQRWGTLISLAVALVVALALLIRLQLSPASAGRPSSRRTGVLSSLLVAAGYLLLAAVLLGSLLQPNGYLQDVVPAWADLDEQVELLGYRLEAPSARAGEPLPVVLYWRGLRGLERDYKSFVHLTDEALTRQPAQHDGDPGGGFSPATRWLPGEIVPDRHDLVLPADLSPGRYKLWAGMYDYDTLRNLPVVEAAAPTLDDRVLLGEIEVQAP